MLEGTTECFFFPKLQPSSSSKIIVQKEESSSTSCVVSLDTTACVQRTHPTVVGPVYHHQIFISGLSVKHRTYPELQTESITRWKLIKHVSFRQQRYFTDRGMPLFNPIVRKPCQPVFSNDIPEIISKYKNKTKQKKKPKTKRNQGVIQGM